MIVVEKGESPLILCLPDAGIEIPPTVEGRFSATGKLQTDVSWRLEQVLEWSPSFNSTIIRSTTSRYVVDPGCDPQKHHLMANEPQVHDALCPVLTLDEKRIYKPGEEPGEIEVAERIALFHAPYHQSLEREIKRVKALHGYVVLINCRSARSRGHRDSAVDLPVINVGTAGGQACLTDMAHAFTNSFAGLGGFNVDLDGYFANCFILDRYGAPARGVHAMNLTVAQRAYLRYETPPFEPDKARMTRLKAVLQDAFSATLDWVQSFYETHKTDSGSAVRATMVHRATAASIQEAS